MRKLFLKYLQSTESKVLYDLLTIYNPSSFNKFNPPIKPRQKNKYLNNRNNNPYIYISAKVKRYKVVMWLPFNRLQEMLVKENYPRNCGQDLNIFL